ncbi:MAG: SLATT domain-containing protein, partial [Myxococcales bacterium]|nr:SLATT domain-containing protein [Myxococcales bacterium]
MKAALRRPYLGRTTMTNTPPIRPNLQPLEMPPLAWDDEHRAASLAQVYAFAETLARETIGWYFKKKSWPKRFSRLLRFAAIALVALGGLDPVLKASGFGICDLIPPLAGAPVCEADWGYLAFALAGAAILFDRFFGVSTGWMRSVTTALAIQRRLRAFQLEWNTLAAKLSTPPSAGEVAVALDAVHRFTESVMAEVQRETEAWVSEFRSNLAELQRRTEDELVNARPGSIHVHVTNPGEADPDTGIT